MESPGPHSNPHVKNSKIPSTHFLTNFPCGTARYFCKSPETSGRRGKAEEATRLLTRRLWCEGGQRTYRYTDTSLLV